MTHPGWMLLDSASALRQPWKNGGGTTRQIAIWPPASTPDTCDWRVSAADVDRAGDFSDWSGYDRHLAVTHGAGMRLSDKESGKTLTLLRDGAVLEFPGERAYACALLDGPVRDCNVMVRRAWGAARMETLRGSASFAVGRGVDLLYCVHGTVVVRGPGLHDGIQLGELDAIQFAGDVRAAETSVQITATGASARCMAIHIRPHGGATQA